MPNNGIWLNVYNTKYYTTIKIMFSNKRQQDRKCLEFNNWIKHDTQLNHKIVKETTYLK